MIEINLLPSGAARRPAASRAARPTSLSGAGADPRIAALGLVAVLVLGFFAFSWWRTGQRQAELTAQIETERQDSTRLANTIALMKTLEQRRDTVERKIAVIRSVDGRRYVWPHLMDEVSRAVPPYTWLTRVAGIEEAPPPPPAAGADSAAAAAPPPAPRGPGFNVEGNAASTQALTRFMKNMEASPMIRDVALVTSEQTSNQGREYLKFTLEARWEQPDSGLIESVPVLPVQ